MDAFSELIDFWDSVHMQAYLFVKVRDSVRVHMQAYLFVKVWDSVCMQAYLFVKAPQGLTMWPLKQPNKTFYIMPLTA
jgi:hypothetical protein